MFQRFFDEGLAQASFLIGCDRTRRAVIVDPRRDAAIYLEAARQHRATIVAAIETHVHADFVSGATELASTGIEILCGPRSDTTFPHRAFADGEVLSLGDVTLRSLHTPGHTPEHICVLAEGLSGPASLFSGDLLFVGGVGRPDLAGDAQTRELAGQLFDSLRRILALPDATIVHPGHGAGSLCGAGIGRDPSTTIGRERAQNAMLQHDRRDAFVAAVLADLPERPAYFARMKTVNADGAPLRGLIHGTQTLPSMKPAAAAALAADGALILDLRPADAFSAGHPYGALNFAFGSKIGYWAGFVLPADGPLLLLSDDPAQYPEAMIQLLRVGLDRVDGSIAGGFRDWVGAGLPTDTIEPVAAASLHDHRSDGVTIVDVRTRREFGHGHIDGAINVPLGELPDRSGELRERGPIATICEGGYRSALAASLLAREGISPIINLVGGMHAYRGGEGA